MDMSKYLGILRWSLQYQDGTEASDVKEMDPERRKWLQEALEANTVDPADQMKTLIEVLKVERQEGKEDYEGFVKSKVEALTCLQEWVESIDWAMDLHKLGGFETLINLMSDQNEDIRSHSMDVFATVVQNNPKSQEWAMELGALGKLAENIERENMNEKEQAKTILAVSSLVRECTKATVSFIKDHKGIGKLTKVVQSDTYGIKAKRKSLFFLRYLLDTVPAIKVPLAPVLIESLDSAIQTDDVDLRENAFHLLITLYGDSNVTNNLDNSIRQKTKQALEKVTDDEEETKQLLQKMKALIVIDTPEPKQQTETPLLC